MRIPVLISSRRIQNKVKQLARQISRDYRHPPERPSGRAGRPPLMICVLNGALVFMANLLRHLTIPVECDFIRLSSYGKTTKSSGQIKVVMDIESSAKGKDVIIVDDIIDTGLTTRFLVNRLKRAKPRSIKICALLDKPARRVVPVPHGIRRLPLKIDYPGFTVPNKFVVGYGIDYKEQYRQLKYVGYLSKI